MKRMGIDILSLLVISVVAFVLFGLVASAQYPYQQTATSEMATAKTAGLYERINVILSEQGMDLGSPAANSLDGTVHYNWAKVQNIKTLEDETARKIRIIAGDTNKFLNMYTQVSLELAKTGVFTGGATSLDPNAHYTWARDNVNYAKTTSGVCNALIDKVDTAMEMVNGNSGYDNRSAERQYNGLSQEELDNIMSTITSTINYPPTICTGDCRSSYNFGKADLLLQELDQISDNNDKAEATTLINDAADDLKNKKFEDAYGCYARVINAYAPNSPYVYDLMGNVAVKWGDYETTLGDNNEARAKYEAALDDYNEAIGINHQFKDAWLGKVAALQKLSRYNEAVSTKNEASHLPDYSGPT